jgi:beta-phosphoglucomutase
MIFMPQKCAIDVDRYKAFLFDMDGVITDTMPLHFEAWRQAFEIHGIKIEPLDVYLREGQTSMQMAEDIARDKNAILSKDTINGIENEKGKIFLMLVNEKARAYDGVKDTLELLRNKGIRTALVTGSRMGSAKGVLSKVSLKDLFDVIITADDVKKGKPGPEPYLKAMEKLGIDKGSCVVVENAPMGILSGKAAGAGYIIALETSLGEEYLKGADEIMKSFSALEKCLAKKFKGAEQ